MKISKTFRLVTLLSYLITLGIFLLGSAPKSSPILDNNVLPGCFTLNSVDSDVQTTSEFAKYDNRYLRIKKTDRIEVVKEIWMTMTKKELWDNWYDKNKRINNLKNSAIYVDRYYFNNPEDALEFAKIMMQGTGSLLPPKCEKSRQIYEEWTEGGYDTKAIGDICWSNKNSYQYKCLQKGNGLVVFFVKGNLLVCVSGKGPENNPIDPRFIEKIAQVVEKRLR